VIYDILFAASAETKIAITVDPKPLGARIGITAVLHTWGSAMTHHPHVHMIVPGGGISAEWSGSDNRRPDDAETDCRARAPCCAQQEDYSSGPGFFR
jgi:hypothetical protein